MLKFFEGRVISDKASQLDVLDGLRGLAALLVVLSHTSNAGYFFAPGLNFTGVGKTGVYLFFLLSAFLLTYQFVSKGSEAFTRGNLTNYALRRFFRIYPLYSVYLLAALLSTSAFVYLFPNKSPSGIPFVLDASEFMSEFFLVSAKGIEWSVLVEFRYYLLLPILAFVYTRLLKNRLLPNILLTVLLMAACSMLWPPSTYWENHHGLGIYAPIFLMGSVLALIHHAIKSSGVLLPKHKLSLEVVGGISIAAIILLFPSVNALLFSEVVGEKFHREFILYAILWSLVLMASIHGTGLLMNILGNNFFRYLGFISFSLYLSHGSIIRLITPLGLGEYLSAWAVLFVSIVFSTITYRLIELPASKIRWPMKKKSS